MLMVWSALEESEQLNNDAPAVVVAEAFEATDSNMATATAYEGDGGAVVRAKAADPGHSCLLAAEQS